MVRLSLGREGEDKVETSLPAFLIAVWPFITRAFVFVVPSCLAFFPGRLLAASVYSWVI